MVKQKVYEFGDLPRKLHPVMRRFMKLKRSQRKYAIDDLKESLAEIASYYESQADQYD